MKRYVTASSRKTQDNLVREAQRFLKAPTSQKREILLEGSDFAIVWSLASESDRREQGSTGTGTARKLCNS